MSARIPQQRIRSRRLDMETLETRNLLAASPWQNPDNPFDVNGDGMAGTTDMLALVAFYQSHGLGPLSPPTDGNAPPPYVDVDGDGTVSTSDVTLMSNFLNTGNGTPGEGDPTPPPRDFPWQNPLNSLDVNNDSFITAVGDVLPLLNELNRPTIMNRSHELPAPTPGSQQPPPFYDVNGDNLLTPVQDVLPLLGHLNGSPADPAEAEVELPFAGFADAYRLHEGKTVRANEAESAAARGDGSESPPAETTLSSPIHPMASEVETARQNHLDTRFAESEAHPLDEVMENIVEHIADDINMQWFSPRTAS